METKKREKILLAATGAVAVLWLLNLLVVSPLIDSWRNRAREIVRLKEQLANGVSLVRRESTIRDRWDNMRANALSNNATAAERQLFTAFDHWVTAGGVTEGSFRPQVQEGDTNFTTVDCRSDVSGSLENVRDFVRAMSKDPLADKVESFELTTKDDNGRQLTLGLSLSGLILTDSDPSAVPPAPRPAEPAPPRGANTETNANLDPFQVIARNNIFDQSRTCGAAVFDGQGTAFFEGAGVSSSKSYSLGDSVSDFKLASITPKTVTLTNGGSNMFRLPTDRSSSLRREDNGPWHLSGYAAVAVTAPDAGTNGTAAPSLSPGSGSTADDIIARLKKKREQE